MDVDSMMLEDVELEPELPASSGKCGNSQHVHVATRMRGVSAPTNPACLHFQTTATTGMPRPVWLDTADTAASSASWKAERKHSRLCEVFPGVGMQRSSAGDAGADPHSISSGPSSAQTVERRKHSTSVHGSIVSFSLQGLKRTVVGAPHAEPEGVRKQGLSSTNMSLARDHMLGFLTFLVCGVASLCCWQFLLSLMPYIENTFFSGIPVGNSLMGVYQVGCICVQLVLMFLVESMRPWVIVATTVFDAALALLFPIVVANGSHRTKMVLTHMVALLFGVSAGVICGCSLAVASALPYNFIGAFSVGQGIAGILSFFIGLAFKELFDLGSAAGLSRMLWLVYGTSCGVSLISACLLLTALRQPWAARQLARYWEAQRLRGSTRQWTVMWCRWLGQPQKGRRSQVVAAVNPDAKQILAAGRAHEREGRNATGTKECEDGCAESNFRTAVKAQGVESNNESRLAASVSAVTYVEATTLRNPVVAAGAGAESGGRAQGPTPDKQLLRSSDAALEAIASTTDTRSTVTAPAELQARETRQQPSDDSEAPVASCFCEGSLKTQTKEEVGSRSCKENASTEPGGVCRISFCSRDATYSEETAVPVEEEKLQPSRGWRYMLRDSGIFLVCVFLNFFVTLNLYPRVGPIMWHYPSFPKNGSQYIILFGVFCLGDFFGKCVMDVSINTRLLSWLMINKKLLLPVVISRVGIAVFFLLGAYMTSHWFFNSFALYVVIMILLAITNGWCATTSLLYVCTSVERFEEREILGPASVLVMQLGIMAGVWTALAYPAP